MPRNPSSARTANHTRVNGPNTAPTAAVPCRCTANSANNMPTVIGMTKLCKPGAAI